MRNRNETTNRSETMKFMTEQGRLYDLTPIAIVKLQAAKTAAVAESVFNRFAAHVPSCDRLSMWAAVEDVNAAMKTGNHTLAVTKESTDLAIVLRSALDVANARQMDVVVRVQYDANKKPRWQGRARRDTARGVDHAQDYIQDRATGRRARKRPTTLTMGKCVLVDAESCVLFTFNVDGDHAAQVDEALTIVSEVVA